ncbi:retrotransposon protein, putative, ty1-copia subclass [Tanacetum coccineum]
MVLSMIASLSGSERPVLQLLYILSWSSGVPNMLPVVTLLRPFTCALAYGGTFDRLKQKTKTRRIIVVIGAHLRWGLSFEYGCASFEAWYGKELLMPRVVKSRDEIFSRWGYCDNHDLSRNCEKCLETGEDFVGNLLGKLSIQVVKFDDEILDSEEGLERALIIRSKKFGFYCNHAGDSNAFLPIPLYMNQDVGFVGSFHAAAGIVYLTGLPGVCRVGRQGGLSVLFGRLIVYVSKEVHTYKARLVAKGHTQTYGIDYEETFSPVADIRAIRILIAIAAYYDYEIWQMDVKTAFLNGRLDEDIYMEQPEGYVNPKYPNRVCKLQRSIYGLKQASRQWNKRFDEEIKKFGFTQNRDEPCVYRKASGSNVVFLILYVDDILIMGNNIPRLKEVKDYLGKCFSMKDLGEAAYILGIKIYRDRSKRLIGLSQSAYIDKILKKFNMHNSKKGYLPMEVKHELSNEMCASTPEEVAYMKKVPYASAVGSIMYAVRCTRPDVAFAQNLVSRYQQNPGKLHWVAVKHILKYLRNTRDMFLVYGGKPDTELNVTGFCDASWQCDKDDTKSQTGYVFVVNGGAVDWKSKKQTTIAMSATQAEYMAASEAAMEAVWIRKFVGDLGVMPSIKEPINMYCDNSAAIIFAKDSGIMKGARHFLRRYHFVREQVESGEIKILKVHTDDNLADPFTKALPRGKVTDHANGIGLQLASSFMHTCD